MLEWVGGWMQANGEAIYGTCPWRRYGESPTVVSEGAFQDIKHEAFSPEDIRYTTCCNILYALRAKPDAGPRRLHALAAGACGLGVGVRRAPLLGHDIELQ